MQAIPKKISIKDTIKFWIKSKFIRYAEYAIFTLPNIGKISRIKIFKKTKNGKFAIVIAGGSSVGKIDGLKLKNLQEIGYDIFAGNSYMYSALGKQILPNYYFLSDDKFFREPIAEQFKEVLKIIYDKRITTFIPHRYCKKIDERDHIHIFNDTTDHFTDNVTDMARPRCYPSMTLYKALSMACYMGYEKIYICGFDNDYFKYLKCNSSNEIYYEDRHYYTNEISENTTRFIDKRSHASVAEFLLHISTLFSGLESFRGQQIVNLDPDSLVDAFTKEHSLDVYVNQNQK